MGGFQLYATKNTHELLKQQGFDTSIMVYKPLVKREPNVLTMLQTGKLDMVIDVPSSMDSQALTDGFEVRRAAVDSASPLISDVKTATLTAMALHRNGSGRSLAECSGITIHGRSTQRFERP